MLTTFLKISGAITYGWDQETITAGCVTNKTKSNQTWANFNSMGEGHMADAVMINSSFSHPRTTSQIVCTANLLCTFSSRSLCLLLSLKAFSGSINLANPHCINGGNLCSVQGPEFEELKSPSETSQRSRVLDYQTPQKRLCTKLHQIITLHQKPSKDEMDSQECASSDRMFSWPRCQYAAGRPSCPKSWKGCTKPDNRRSDG